MSIRLKKVQWEGEEVTGFRALIVHTTYIVNYSQFDVSWVARIGLSEWRSYHKTIDDAKSACEQHALERIREAVEVGDSGDKTIDERDDAEEAADTMAALILNEHDGWMYHDDAWRRAIETLRNPNRQATPDSWKPTLERMLDKYQRLNAMYADDEAMHKHRDNITAGIVSGAFRAANRITIYDLERLIAGKEIYLPDYLPKPPKEGEHG